jgi:hypothetical protein
MVHITAATTNAVGSPRGILIQINLGWTGTITVSDAIGTQAIITNPVLGQQFKYYGFTGAVSVVTTGTTEDCTVSNLTQVS